MSSRSRALPVSNAALRSRGELPGPGTEIYVADTLGELGLIYRLAPIVFVGGSLASHGGQNPIEPIKLGAAILHGPNVWNFAEIYAALDATGGAELVTDAGKLTLRIGSWLKDTEAREKVAQTALKAMDTLRRCARSDDRVMDALRPAAAATWRRRPGLTAGPPLGIIGQESGPFWFCFQFQRCCGSPSRPTTASSC